MFNKHFLIWIVFFAILLFSLLSCDKNNKEFAKAWDSSDESSDNSPPNCLPDEYFPLTPGTTWTYKINVENDPMQYNITSWPVGDKAMSYSNIGLFSGTFNKNAKKEFILKIKINKPIAKYCGMSWSKMFELEILQDELGVFENVDKVVYAITNGGRFTAYQIVGYPPDSPGAPTSAWGNWGSDPGTSMRVVFFGSKPGIQIGLTNSEDAILFDGLIKSSEYSDPVLKFIRTVTITKKEDPVDKELDIFSKGFKEETLFARNVGMVSLVQKRDEKVTMSWSLVDFIPGKK